jgi:hypothetical protein
MENAKVPLVHSMKKPIFVLSKYFFLLKTPSAYTAPVPNFLLIKNGVYRSYDRLRVGPTSSPRVRAILFFFASAPPHDGV